MVLNQPCSNTGAIQHLLKAFGFLLFLCSCSLLHDDSIQTSAFSVAECFGNGSKRKE